MHHFSSIAETAEIVQSLLPNSFDSSAVAEAVARGPCLYSVESDADRQSFRLPLGGWMVKRCPVSLAVVAAEDNRCERQMQ